MIEHILIAVMKEGWKDRKRTIVQSNVLYIVEIVGCGVGGCSSVIGTVTQSCVVISYSNAHCSGPTVVQVVTKTRD